MYISGVESRLDLFMKDPAIGGSLSARQSSLQSGVREPRSETTAIFSIPFLFLQETICLVKEEVRFLASRRLRKTMRD